MQGGLEIACRVSVSMPETLKNKEIIAKYKDMVDVLYVELDDCAVLGSFVDHTIDVPNQSGKKVNKRTSGKASTQKEFKKPKCDQVKTI